MKAELGPSEGHCSPSPPPHHFLFLPYPTQQPFFSFFLFSSPSPSSTWPLPFPFFLAHFSLSWPSLCLPICLPKSASLCSWLLILLLIPSPHYSLLFFSLLICNDSDSRPLKGAWDFGSGRGTLGLGSWVTDPSAQLHFPLYPRRPTKLLRECNLEPRCSRSWCFLWHLKVEWGGWSQLRQVQFGEEGKRIWEWEQEKEARIRG